MAKKNIIRGRFVKFDVTGLRVNESLTEALNILDGECRYGSGGTWDIHRFGQKIVATPVDGPFDTLYFNRSKGSWGVL